MQDRTADRMHEAAVSREQRTWRWTDGWVVPGGKDLGRQAEEMGRVPEAAGKDSGYLVRVKASS